MSTAENSLKEKPSDPIARRWLVWAMSLANEVQWPLAEQAFRAALVVDKTGWSHVTFAREKLLREEFSDTMPLLTVALERASSQGDLSLVALSSTLLSIAYRTLGDFDLARRFQQRALQVQPDFDEADLIRMAGDALGSGCPELAEALCDSAIDLQEGTATADDLGMLGLAAAFQDQPEQGFSWLWQAYREHANEGDVHGQGVDALNLAEIAGHLGRPAMQRRWLERAIEHFKAARSPHSSAKARFRLQEWQRFQAKRTLPPNPEWN